MAMSPKERQKRSLKALKDESERVERVRQALLAQARREALKRERKPSPSEENGREKRQSRRSALEEPTIGDESAAQETLSPEERQRNTRQPLVDSLNLVDPQIAINTQQERQYRVQRVQAMMRAQEHLDEELQQLEFNQNLPRMPEEEPPGMANVFFNTCPSSEGEEEGIDYPEGSDNERENARERKRPKATWKGSKPARKDLCRKCGEVFVHRELQWSDGSWTYCCAS
jgi:hypothetical protein